ncbi:MAG: hypothetical protein WCO20_09270, partial [Holophagaceae bacterium]
PERPHPRGVSMRLLSALLLLTPLVAQEGGSGPRLGSDPLEQIRFAPPGCWDSLVLHAAPRSQEPRLRSPGQATVEVWDLAPRESRRTQTFSFYLDTLRERLSRGFQAPPPSHQALELSEIMQEGTTNPQKLDLTKVKSLQERFNQLPPNGTPQTIRR